jgi:uncharacterized protein YegJ (DUF2314 family)
MFSFLSRELPATGHVLYPGAIPPPLEQLSALREPVTWTGATASADQVWSVEATHPAWGSAEIACLRRTMPLPAELIDHALSLTADEKSGARMGEAAVAVRVRAQQKHVLRDRKRLLFWLRALMQPDGVVGIDDASTLCWSRAMLDDELAHDAELDIESLYTIHAVQDSQDPARVEWLHTHGLEELSAFDVDVLRPSSVFVANCGDPIRALAFAALEGSIAPDAARFRLVHPGGDVRLVPVDRYQADAAPEDRRIREPDPGHSGRRAVLCEPVGGLFARWRARPAPSRFLSSLDTDGFVIPFSTAATTLMSARASQTLSVFCELKEEFGSFDLPALVKLGYTVDGGASEDREHLWFAVHQVLGDKVDATLANSPHRVSSLAAGQRGEFGLDRLTDWMILSPEGPMTPRNVSAARRLRANREMWQARIDAAQPVSG